MAEWRQIGNAALKWETECRRIQIWKCTMGRYGGDAMTRPRVRCVDDRLLSAMRRRLGDAVAARRRKGEASHEVAATGVCA